MLMRRRWIRRRLRENRWRWIYSRTTARQTEQTGVLLPDLVLLRQREAELLVAIVPDEVAAEGRVTDGTGDGGAALEGSLHPARTARTRHRRAHHVQHVLGLRVRHVGRTVLELLTLGQSVELRPD